MSALMQPVIIRFLTYVLSPLVLLLPAWAAGAVTINDAGLSLSLGTAATIISAALVGSGGILAKWGAPLDGKAMAGLLTRLLTYVTSTSLAALPALPAGLVVFDPTTSILTLSFTGIAAMAAGAIGGSAAVFGKWGVK